MTHDDDISKSTEAPKARRLLTTAQAAHVLLGGTDTEPYWGFTFQEFHDKLQVAMVKHIGNPTDAPWRRHLDFTAQDYLELNAITHRLDSVQDPANHLDFQIAMAFARRSDIVGMHGGVNGIGVGKDTVADALKPHGFVSLAFADTLKVSLSMAYGVPMRFFTERALKQEPLPGTQLNPRRLMQLWGTEVCRSISEHIHLKRHLLRVASPMLDLSNIARTQPYRISSTGGVRIAVPDVRFANESAYIHNMGGFNAWISRPSLVPVAAQLSHGHASEAGIPSHPTDAHLVNEGTLEQFQAEASRVVLARFTPSDAATARRLAKP